MSGHTHWEDIRPRYWIWSNEHGLWWRSHRMGYTSRLNEAGIYSAAEVTRILGDNDLSKDWHARDEVAFRAMVPAVIAVEGDPNGEQ